MSRPVATLGRVELTCKEARCCVISGSCLASGSAGAGTRIAADFGTVYAYSLMTG